MDAPRLRIGVIGVGRAGGVMAAAWQRAGHHVMRASARSDITHLRAEALIPQAEIVPVRDVPQGMDLVLVAVPDDALGPLIQTLVEQGAVEPGQIWCHLAGRYGIEVMTPAADAGALVCALHPIMTFTGTSVDVGRLVDCPFGVTAPDSIRAMAQTLVIEAGGEPIWVPEEGRARYHAALALSANSLAVLAVQARDLLSSAGVEDPQLLLAPLLHATVDNALRLGDAAMTGPVARGDVGSVQSHVQTIAEYSLPAADAYRSLARLITDRALAAGLLDMKQAADLLAVLNR
jgi:predicted short-subunit dehydrogenase-like oxidoreductase (DUF2520 family)